MTFQELGVDQDMVDALNAKGITEPFPIQLQTIPLAIAGQDVIGQAKTGTGKTLGFGLPLLQRIGHDPADGVQALIVVPTRELCVQVTEDLELAASNRPVKIVSIYGGKAYEGQIEQLKAGAQVVVGTPGRLIDLLGQHQLSFAGVREMVLDEADKMLDLGFLPDIEKLFAKVPETRHTMLFSATMPGAIVALARRFMNRPVHIRASEPDEGTMQANIKHVVYRAHSLDKDEVIARILQAEGRGKTVIFTRTKRAAARLVEELNDRGFNAAAVHGDLSQEQRERHMAAFKAGKKDVLIATDVAARGIDVDDVTHVINHTIPEDEKAYLHRVGRTGRAGKTGIAVTFVDWDDVHKWALIDRALDFGQPEPRETYSSSPHLFTDLHIPEGTRGRVSPRRSAVAATGTGADVQDAVAAPSSEGTAGSTRTRSRRRRGGSGRGVGGAGAPPEATAAAPQSGESVDSTQHATVQTETSERPAGSGTHDGTGPTRRRRRRRPTPGTPAS